MAISHVMGVIVAQMYVWPAIHCQQPPTWLYVNWLKPLVQVGVVFKWNDSKLELIHNIIEGWEHMNCEIRAAKAIIADFKDRHSKAWRSFCLKVHQINTDGYNACLEASTSLNHLAIRWGDFKVMVNIEAETESNTEW